MTKLSKTPLKFQFAASAGLCNRLKGLVSIFRKNVPFTVFQPQSNLFPGKLQDILDNPIEDHFTREGRLVDWRLVVSPEESQGPIDLIYARVSSRLRAMFLSQFYSLRFKPELIPAETEQYDFAVHIRESKDWTIAGRQTPLEDYFAEIDRHNPEKFLAIVQTQAVEDAVRGRYGDRAIFHPTRRHEAADVAALRQWTKELLLLSKSKQIVGHCLSTFTETAWWLGGCHAAVYPVGKKKTKEKV